VPPFVGFFAKLYVIQAVLQIGLTWLAVVAVLFSVIGAFYYLRIVKVMFFDTPPEGVAVSAGTALKVLLSLNALGVLALGIFNSGLVEAIARALP
jgi:NADH-quinone oxidoreductase subunit N